MNLAIGINGNTAAAFYAPAAQKDAPSLRGNLTRLLGRPPLTRWQVLVRRFRHAPSFLGQLTSLIPEGLVSVVGAAGSVIVAGSAAVFTASLVTVVSAAYGYPRVNALLDPDLIILTGVWFYIGCAILTAAFGVDTLSATKGVQWRRMPYGGEVLVDPGELVDVIRVPASIRKNALAVRAAMPDAEIMIEYSQVDPFLVIARGNEIEYTDHWIN